MEQGTPLPGVSTYEEALAEASRPRPYIRTEDVYQTDKDDGTAGYSDKALALVSGSEKTGVPQGANAVGMVGAAKHGVVAVQLFARVNPDTRIVEEAGFRAHGCLAMIASGAAAALLVEGRPIEEAAACTPQAVAGVRGEVPADKRYTATYAAEAARAMAGDFELRRGATFEQMESREHACDPDSVSCILCENCSLRDSLVDLRFGGPRG